MEKRKAQMIFEERDKRVEELENQMMNIVGRIESSHDNDSLDFSEEEAVLEPEVETVEEEITLEEPKTETIEEEVLKPEVEEKKPKKERKRKPKKEEKKKTDKQVSLLSF